VHLQLVLGTKPSRFLLPSQNPPSSRTLTPLQHKQRLENFAQTRVIALRAQDRTMLCGCEHHHHHPSWSHHHSSITSNGPNFFQIGMRIWCKFVPPTYLPSLPICIASYKLTNVNIFSRHAIVLDASERPKNQLHPPHPPTSSLPPPQDSIRSSISFFFFGEILSKTEIQNSTN
jgi:hypothetical protein